MDKKNIEEKIRAGLTGSADEQVHYLQSTVEEYLGTPDSEYVTNFCSQLMYDILLNDRGDDLTIEF